MVRHLSGCGCIRPLYPKPDRPANSNEYVWVCGGVPYWSSWYHRVSRESAKVRESRRVDRLSTTHMLILRRRSPLLTVPLTSSLHDCSSLITGSIYPSPFSDIHSFPLSSSGVVLLVLRVPPRPTHSTITVLSVWLPRLRPTIARRPLGWQ